jgi:1A family penicillin-binding protein
MGDVREGAKRRPRWLLWLRLFLRMGLAGLLMASIAGAAGFVYAYKKYGSDLPDVSVLETYRPSQTTRILASDGSVITTLFQENRVWAPLDEISPWVGTAVVATEDSRFYEHHGVDPIGVARVIFNLIRTGEAHEGASTLTMQLSRGVFPLGGEGDEVRKIKEMFLSTRIEKRYDKKKILELYLNQVYFGAGAYGIHSAARVYFDKGPKDLTLAEASLLAGLIQAPSRFNPLEHPDRAFTRQDEVLGRMLATGAITQEQFDGVKAARQKMKFGGGKKRSTEVDRFPYFTSYVIQELTARYDEEDLYRGGLTVVTTLDPAVQSYAQQTLTREVSNLGYELDVDAGALVLLENETGYIKALVGGLGWTEKNQFNRAVQARRQPGSSFKPATYGAALEAGYTPESRVNDRPVTYQDGSAGGYSPKNSDGKYLGVITMRQALQGSRNVPAVKILDAVGVDNVIALAYRMGIRAEIPPNLSIALGAIEATPLEMAEFYSVIANGGRRVHPTAIKVIKDSSGKVLEDHRASIGETVLSPQTVLALTSMLQDVVRAGTGTNAQVSGWPIAGKTGTTDSSVDAWFCGFSPYYTCTVWVGNDDNHPMYNSYGGDLPATVFRQVMGYVLQGKEYKDFPAYTPSGGEARDILKPGETPTPSESASASASPTPEASQTPLAEETPLATASPTSGQDGRSYLLPETLDHDLPDLPPMQTAPMPIVTPAPLPEEVPSQGGSASGASQPEIPDVSAPPVPAEVKLPNLESE